MTTSVLKRAGWFAIGLAIPVLAIGMGLATGTEEASSNGALPDLPIEQSEAHDAITDARSSVPAPQRRALEDGYADFDEYMAAVTANLACIRSRIDEYAATNYPAGAVEVVVSDPRPSDDRFQATYTYGIRSIDGTNVGDIDDIATGIEALCQEELLSATQTVYQARLLADNDYVDDTEDRLLRCLSGSGVQARRGVTAREALTEVMQADGDEPPEAVVDCIGRFPSMTGTLEGR